MIALRSSAVQCRPGAAFSAAPRRALCGARVQRLTVARAGKQSKQPVQEPEAEDVGVAGLAAAALGLAANPIMLWSEYTLQTTGSGLPEGPGGALGAAEGVSYLVVLGIIAWSIATKVNTGSGLPAGPYGLLGAVEGVSYLSLLAGIVVFALKFLS